MLKRLLSTKTTWFVLFMIIGFATVCVSNELDWYYKKGEHQGWKKIVIHHSATSAGSAKAFHRYHTTQGYGGLAYHFVIGNGSGTGDGIVETGFRWDQQITGTHVSVNSWQHNIFGIGICLVGNFETAPPTAKQWASLVDLVAKLSREHKISVEEIIGHHHVPFDNNAKKHEQTSCPGKQFPLAKLRQAVAAKLSSN